MLAAFVPLGVVTSTLATPGLPAGMVQLRLVLLIAVTSVAGTPPNVTLLTAVRFVPVIVTVLPPTVTPLYGAMAVTVGGVSAKLKSALGALVPPGVVTCTLAVPPLPLGVVHVMLVLFTTVTPVAAAPPMLTPVAPEKLLPVIVTLVPPFAVPLVGEMLLTMGATTYVYRALVPLLPPVFVTVTLTVPAACPGVLHVIVVPPPPTVKPVTAVPPKVTPVAQVKLVPVIVTLVPPPSGPLETEMPVTVGTATYV